MFDVVEKQVCVMRKNGAVTSGSLIEQNNEYVLLMRDCEYYLVYVNEIVSILAKA